MKNSEIIGSRKRLTTARNCGSFFIWCLLHTVFHNWKDCLLECRNRFDHIKFVTLCGAYWIPSEEEILIINNYYTKKISIKIAKEHYMTIWQLWSPMFKFLIFLILLITVIAVGMSFVMWAVAYDMCNRERKPCETKFGNFRVSHTNCIMLGSYYEDYNPFFIC